jgi:hypothetical protein
MSTRLIYLPASPSFIGKMLAIASASGSGSHLKAANCSAAGVGGLLLPGSGVFMVGLLGGFVDGVFYVGKDETDESANVAFKSGCRLLCVA